MFQRGRGFDLGFNLALWLDSLGTGIADPRRRLE
jgi:hypothetical protein